jgi:uncharacterized protein (TIRG00374 family)
MLALAAGVSFFTWYLSRVGLVRVWEGVEGLGAWAPLVLLPYFGVYVIDCLAWAQTLPNGKVPFLTLFRFRWAGEAVNYVLPTAYVGGEAVKVCLLRGHGMSGADGAVSAIVSKTAQTIAQLAFVLVASIVLFTRAQDRPDLRLGVGLVGLCGLTAVAALLWVQNRGVFRITLAVLRRLRWRCNRLEQWRSKLLQLDETIVGFYRSQPRRFYASTGLYLCGWLLDTVEIYVVANLLGFPLAWPQALIVEAFTGVAKALGTWIPGSLGVQESGIVLAGAAAGLPPTLSATYALIRRFREILYAAVGLILLYAGGALRPGSQPKVAT